MNQREASRENWNSKDTFESINSGSLQRIADATEAMAQNFLRLQADNKNLLGRNERYYDRIKRLERSVAALKGHLKRAKNNINQ